MRKEKARLRWSKHRKRVKGGNHSNMITDYKVYHPGRDLSNGGFCNG